MAYFAAEVIDEMTLCDPIGSAARLPSLSEIAKPCGSKSFDAFVGPVARISPAVASLSSLSTAEGHPQTVGARADAGQGEGIGRPTARTGGCFEGKMATASTVNTVRKQ